MVHLLLAVIYLSFISLGLPDALLGSAWPTIYGELGVPVSYMGIISMIISAGTVVSSLCSDRLTRRLGAGGVTALSVGVTAAALFGFSVSRSFLALCLWAVPYGLGAGSVDAALNNYVALHYTSRHMSWLHCMWGIGASLGPYAMTFALAGGQGWNMALPVHQLPADRPDGDPGAEPGSVEGPVGGGKWRGTGPPPAPAIAAPGTREMMLLFFCYCALETTAGQWASSYLVLARGLDEQTAAGCASLFYLGVTGGRALSGFLTMRLSDRSMVRLGLAVITVGVLALLLPLGPAAAFAGFVLTVWAAPPSTPAHPRHPGSLRGGPVPGPHRHPDGQRLCGHLPDAAPLRPHGQPHQRLPLPWYLVVFLSGMALAHQRLYYRCRGSAQHFEIKSAPEGLCGPPALIFMIVFKHRNPVIYLFIPCFVSRKKSVTP